MPNTEDPFGEDASLLYPNKRVGVFVRYPEAHRETPIIKGVAKQLRRWPEDIFFAFLAACLIVGCIAFLIFVTVIICLPTVLGNRVEEISILEVGTSPNIYFIKLENQNWSTRDFCYIETAARRHPDFNVYLINLMKVAMKESLNRSSINRTRLESKTNDSNSYHSSAMTPEERLGERIVLGNGNVRSINVTIDRFFKGSKLSNIANELDDDVLEIAAKAQLLWSVPGIALKPSMFCMLDAMKNFLCSGNEDDCSPDKLATIEPDNDIQLTGVPCQAFMGFLVQEISRNNHDGRYTLKKAMEKYCPRLYYCPEIRILDSRKCPTDNLDCPTVYSAVLMHDYAHAERFYTS